MEALKISVSGRFFIPTRFSRILSQTTMVSLISYPITVRKAARISQIEFFSRPSEKAIKDGNVMDKTKDRS